MKKEAERPIDFTHPFYTDPDARQWDTVVTACKEAPYAFAAASTIFYPEGGGQPGDQGLVLTPDGHPLASITDTQYDEDGTIWHFTDQPLQVDTPVQLQLDWERRFDLTQQHSAEHLVSGIIKQLYGFENVGFHINERFTTLDTSGELPPDALPELTRRMNEIIWANLPFVVSLHDPSEIIDRDYRSKIALPHTVRLVTVEEVDTCACCGTHLHTTGQIGQLRFIDAQRHRGGTRLTMLAGQRALLDAETLQAQALQLSSRLSSPRLQLSSGLDTLESKLQDAEQQIRDLSAALVEAILPPTLEHLTLWVVPDAISDKDLKFHMKRCQLSGEAALLLLRPQTQNTYRFMLASPHAEQQTRITEALRSFTTLKGGGPPQLSQGTFTTDHDPMHTLEAQGWHTL